MTGSLAGPATGFGVPADRTSAPVETSPLLRPGCRAVKRALDIVGAALGLTLCGPLILACSLVVKLIDPGSALFAHRREGWRGASFRMWKIRSMRQHESSELDRHLAAHTAVAEQWRRHFKLVDDPRVVPGVGRLLRRLSLDELPQLWNVLKGEMSLVGPRPLPDYQVEHLDPEFRRLRCAVRPGMTGLWQVSARASGDLEQHRVCDTRYIRDWSPRLELSILAKTILAVVSGEGAV